MLVRFGRQVAQNVAEVTWHKTQQLQFNADGTLDFRVTVSGLNEISWWILGYGDQAEVLEPPELRKMIAERIKRMAKMYELKDDRWYRGGELLSREVEANRSLSLEQSPQTPRPT